MANSRRVWTWANRKSKTAQEELLSQIWLSRGGPAEVSRILNVGRQIPMNWRKRSGVPIALCPDVARQLKLVTIQILGLNYLGVSNFISKPVPSWETVVRSFKFHKEIEQRILDLPPPNKDVN